MQTQYIFDIETDSLNATKIHVLSVCYLDKSQEWQIKSTTDYEEMKKFFTTENCIFIGHNVRKFDIPVAERILGVKLHENSNVIDTLPLSQYYFHERSNHKLESWGDTIGIEKPIINDWENLPFEKYIERCEADVKITVNLWVRLYKVLMVMYGTEEQVLRFCYYLADKMYAAALAEKFRWKLNVDQCKKNLVYLEQELEGKLAELRTVMPALEVKKTISKPNSLYGKGGKMSKAGEQWLNIIKEKGLPLDHEEDIEITVSYKAANPKSPEQRKAWLFSLGWEPQTFDIKTNTEGEKREVPQILTKGGDPCESVVALIEKHPEVDLIIRLGSLVQRTAMLRKWIASASEDGYMVAGTSGLTNQLRFIHSGLVNIPTTGKPYGEYIRSCLIADKGFELCGADMSALETLTKLHYIKPYDRRYVEEQLSEDFDPHLSLALHAGALNAKEVAYYKEYKAKPKDFVPTDDEKKEYTRIHEIRAVYKLCGYALVYGSGAEGVARAANIPLKDAKAIRQSYWKWNWSVKKIAASAEVRELDGKKWLKNPVSGFWHSVRSDKDVFSVLNSSTGVYCFDLWIKFILEKRPQLNGQFHDEIVLQVKKGYRKEVEQLLREALDRVNKTVKLNVPLGISIQFGKTYADIH